MRYYMHVSNGPGFVEDEEGCELPDEAAARRVAINAARDVMASDLRDGELDLTAWIRVENETHEPLFTLSFAEAVSVKTADDPVRRLPTR